MVMEIQNILNLKNIKLIFITVLVGVLFILNLFVLNKVITNTPEETKTERQIRFFH
jgi:hypothetical protein